MTADELHALLAEYHNPKVVIGELIYKRIQTVVNNYLSRRDLRSTPGGWRGRMRQRTLSTTS
jgi:hypothetical protein